MRYRATILLTLPAAVLLLSLALPRSTARADYVTTYGYGPVPCWRFLTDLEDTKERDRQLIYSGFVAGWMSAIGYTDSNVFKSAKPSDVVRRLQAFCLKNTEATIADGLGDLTWGQNGR
ncbi:MAG TPA: hypothetical protein VGD08_03405 [Stellaceae bacterium]|jgi:hypothetical protein